MSFYNLVLNITFLTVPYCLLIIKFNFFTFRFYVTHIRPYTLCGMAQRQRKQGSEADVDNLTSVMRKCTW